MAAQTGIKKEDIIMKNFTYTITDPLGIHARPAGLLAKAARVYADTVITVEKNGNAVKASQLMKLMGLGVKQGDVITVTADGASEDIAIEAMKEFFRNKL